MTREEIIAANPNVTFGEPVRKSQGMLALPMETGGVKGFFCWIPGYPFHSAYAGPSRPKAFAACADQLRRAIKHAQKKVGSR